MKDTLFIIDDHKVISAALKEWIENNSKWLVIGTAADSNEALEKLRCMETDFLPEIVIFDIQLKDEESFSLIKKVREDFQCIKAVVYSMFEITGYAMLARECGAMGYVSKAAPQKEFFKCLECVQKGEEYIQENLLFKMKKAMDAVKFLTNQERRVFEEIINGSSNEEIANKLELGLHTTEVYVSRIFKKLGVSYRGDLIEKFK